MLLAENCFGLEYIRKGYTGARKQVSLRRFTGRDLMVKDMDGMGLEKNCVRFKDSRQGVWIHVSNHLASYLADTQWRYLASQIVHVTFTTHYVVARVILDRQSMTGMQCAAARMSRALRQRDSLILYA